MQPIVNDVHYREGYQDPSPYPEIEVLHPDPCAAHLLMEDYAGGTSEFTAVHQYLYHHTTLNSYPDVAELLEKVAIVEMMHMEKLAQMIVLLGEKPVYGNPDPWCADQVAYGETLCERLHMDLASEYAAIRQYQAHIEQISDPNVKDLLARIIKDEQVHVRLFQEAIARHFC